MVKSKKLIIITVLSLIAIAVAALIVITSSQDKARRERVSRILQGTTTHLNRAVISKPKGLYVNIAEMDVDIRKNPANTAEIIGQLRASETIKGKEDGVWIQCIHNGETGFIAKDYLEAASYPLHARIIMANVVGDYLHIVGRVINTSEDMLRNIEVQIVLLGEIKKVVASRYVSVQPANVEMVLAPGDEANFSLQMKENRQIASVKVRVNRYQKVKNN